MDQTSSVPHKPKVKGPKPDRLLRRLNNYSIYQTFRRAIRDCQPKGPILLAPCGYGWFFERFRKDNMDVVGIDIEPHKVEFALKKVNPPYKVVEGNILEMPFKDGEFDFVISNRFLLHFNDDFRARAFKSLARVTGRYLLVHYDYVHSVRQFSRVLRFAEAPEKDFSQYEGYRVWKRHGRKLRYTREMMAKEGADAGLKMKKLYFVSYLLSERVYCLYEKA
ncbi:MAG TPA: class I SAM-dependent methyltransferase [Planctomycetota bacterium]|nr:class I SAM-dependent methyltransferase [Planctomycetota bacterium]